MLSTIQQTFQWQRFTFLTSWWIYFAFCDAYLDTFCEREQISELECKAEPPPTPPPPPP